MPSRKAPPPTTCTKLLACKGMPRTLQALQLLGLHESHAWARVAALKGLAAVLQRQILTTGRILR